MKDAPILRSHRIPDEKIEVYGGLCYHDNNPKPYFSITHIHYIKERGRWEIVRCGAFNEETKILELWPELKPLADLHLSDIDGVPIHAAENGLYWIAGAAGGLGWRFHGGNGFPARTPEGCVTAAAHLLRVSEAEIEDMVRKCQVEHDAWRGSSYNGTCKYVAFKVWIESKKLQWKAEADQVIESLQLQVFGDKQES